MKATTAVFAACFLYFALFRSYGFQVEDEGTLLFWLDRVLRGEFPYVDFHTGYTPGFFYLGAALLKLSGENANNLRVFVALINAGTAAGLYVVSRRFVGPWMAAVPAVLWVAFLPVYPGEFASFNVPYPAWFATLAWVGVALSLLRFVENGRLRDLAVAGVVAAVAFAMKPNAGAFALAAASWVTVGASRNRTSMDRMFGVVATLLMAVGVWGAFGFAVSGVDAAVHLIPLVGLVVLFGGVLAGRYADVRHPGTGTALCVLGVSFLVPTSLWVIPVLGKLGVEGFARDVLLIGSNAARLYYEAPEAPQRYALAVVGTAVGLAGGGWLVRKRLVSPTILIVFAIAAAAVAAVLTALYAVMPESAWLSVSFQLENSAYWLAPLVHAAGLTMLVVSARRSRPLGAERALAVIVPCAVAMYWQVFPRTDFMHVVISVPLTMVLGTWLLVRVSEWWIEGAWPMRLPSRRIVYAAGASIVAMLVVLETGPVLVSGVRCLARGEMVIDTERVRACIDPEVSDDLKSFDAAVRYLRQHAQVSEAALPFPAVAGLLFTAALSSPVPHDYWFPGRPSHEDEQRMLETIRGHPPRLVVTLNDGWTFFLDAPEYFLDLRRFTVENYRLTARFGRFDILARNDIAASLPSVREEAPRATPLDSAEPWLPKRRQAVRGWMAHVRPEEAAQAELPAGARTSVLLLRALRDGGDVRAAGWLLAGYASADRRIHEEAVSAMGYVAQRTEAEYFRWANDLDMVGLRPFLVPFTAQARDLSGNPDMRVRKFAAVMSFGLGTDSIDKAVRMEP